MLRYVILVVPSTLITLPGKPRLEHTDGWPLRCALASSASLLIKNFNLNFKHSCNIREHSGASVSEVIAHAYVSGDVPSAALPALALYLSRLSVACRRPGEMTALLALDLALCCSNVTYRQPGNIYSNTVTSAAAGHN